MVEVLLFEGMRAMGEPRKSLWTRMVSSWKCVFVELCEDRLAVGLHGPLGPLMRLFAPYLDHVIPLGSIRPMERRTRSVLGQREVSVVFGRGGSSSELCLNLREADRFAGMLKGMLG